MIATLCEIVPTLEPQQTEKCLSTSGSQKYYQNVVATLKPQIFIVYVCDHTCQKDGNPRYLLVLKCVLSGKLAA